MIDVLGGARGVCGIPVKLQLRINVTAMPMEIEEALKVSIWEWLNDTGEIHRVQQQCEDYRKTEKVNAQAKTHPAWKIAPILASLANTWHAPFPSRILPSAKLSLKLTHVNCWSIMVCTVM